VNTAQYWNTFGQIVILVLVQLGGFGIMTGATLVLLSLRGRIGLQQRLLIGQSFGQAGMGGVVGLLKRMALFVLITEIFGTLVFFIRFSADKSVVKAAWLSVFHSVSAFNNAGFDIFGGSSSMQAFRGDTVIVIATALLIVLGGISFVVIDNSYRSRKFGKLSPDSKMCWLPPPCSCSQGGGLPS
jgi:trk system potassium uptake protein TrkH